MAVRERERRLYCDDEIFVFAFDASFIRDDDFFYDNLLCITRECRAPIGFSNAATIRDENADDDERE